MKLNCLIVEQALSLSYNVQAHVQIWAPEH